jgi:protein-histidine pros-kinase
VAAKYPDYSYRQVALNPTNTDDRPDPFEVELTDQFKSGTGLTELSGVRQVGDQSLFYVARPIRIEDPNCLACHSTPERAPPSMLALYGPANGFGWVLHDTVGVQVISVPVTSELRNAVALSIAIAAGLLVIFGLTYLTLTATLDRAVVGPLRGLAAAADAASRGSSEPVPFSRSAAAEIGQLAAALQRLRTSLEKAIRRAAQRDDSDEPEPPRQGKK